MTILLLFLTCFLAGTGLFQLICACMDVPTRATSRAMLLSRKQKGITGDNMMDVYLTKVSDRLSFLLHLDPVKRSRLQATLTICGIPLTPECYTMKALLTALLTASLGIPLGMLMPLISLVMTGLGVLMWFATYYKAFDQVKKRKKDIETELPRFAASIQQSLSTDRDVLKLLISYRRVAGPDLGNELDTTIADMKTGNYENALLRFQNRIGSTLLSDIVRGLIGTLRGDDQQMYFKMLVFDMRQMEQSNLKKEAQKRPKQMQRYSMMMLLCILLIYAVVLSMEVFSSLGSFF